MLSVWIQHNPVCTVLIIEITDCDIFPTIRKELNHISLISFFLIICVYLFDCCWQILSTDLVCCGCKSDRREDPRWGLSGGGQCVLLQSPRVRDRQERGQGRGRPPQPGTQGITLLHPEIERKGRSFINLPVLQKLIFWHNKWQLKEIKDLLDLFLFCFTRNWKSDRKLSLVVLKETNFR